MVPILALVLLQVAGQAMPDALEDHGDDSLRNGEQEADLVLVDADVLDAALQPSEAKQGGAPLILVGVGVVAMAAAVAVVAGAAAKEEITPEQQEAILAFQRAGQALTSLVVFAALMSTLEYQEMVEEEREEEKQAATMWRQAGEAWRQAAHAWSGVASGEPQQPQDPAPLTMGRPNQRFALRFTKRVVTKPIKMVSSVTPNFMQLQSRRTELEQKLAELHATKAHLHKMVSEFLNPWVLCAIVVTAVAGYAYSTIEPQMKATAEMKSRKSRLENELKAMKKANNCGDIETHALESLDFAKDIAVQEAQEAKMRAERKKPDELVQSAAITETIHKVETAQQTHYMVGLDSAIANPWEKSKKKIVELKNTQWKDLLPKTYW